MKVLTVSVTERGRGLAQRLPWPTVHGDLASVVRDRWCEVDAFVLFAAAGIAVRVVGPLLTDKAEDPAVVCVDESGRWAVALSGGHARGANDLARNVASLLGATPVVTTATDSVGLPPLDTAYPVTGDTARVTRLVLDGGAGVHNPMRWPLPQQLAALPEGRDIVVSDLAEFDGGVAIRPPSLVVGIGTSSDAAPGEVADLADAALEGGGLSRLSVGAIATIDRRAAAPAIVALATSWDVPIRSFGADTLAHVDVPHPSAVVAGAVGTPSVAEAAALAAAGAGAELIVAKQKSAAATVAIARRAGPQGHLAVVGIGPGDAAQRTPAATAAIAHAEVVVGYDLYLDLIADAIAPGTTVIGSPIGDERGRVTTALDSAADGRKVALVCSGDAGVYALATLVFELAPEFPSLDPFVDIEVVPGVTAALAAAALLGAPLAHDHAAISLSDLLTPWEVIERRLEAAGAADLVVTLYNPRSAGRSWQLGAACAILARHRPEATPVGVVTDAGRPGQRATITTLASLRPEDVNMTTCIVIGSSETRVIDGRMVTPRGYGGRGR